MIISASYRTDIPAFYGEWFMRRLQAGFCGAVNPYNQRPYRVPLDRRSVAGFVFWTKNLGPFLPHLAEVQQRGFPFVIQHTINGYPRALETSVVDAAQSVEHAWRVREQFGSAVLVWRYDTILLSSVTPPAHHLATVARLAQALEGATDEVVVSFAQIYAKTRRNLDRAAAAHGFQWHDPPAADKRTLIGQLGPTVARHGMKLTVCAQRELLIEGAEDARCIDAERLQRIAGRPVPAKRTGHRKQCGCSESRDIGEYDTCPHGCVYCYAVQNRDLARRRHREHDPDAELLLGDRGSRTPGDPERQLSLLPDE
jgi:hypothetical protein